MVSRNFFSGLGIHPFLGRGFTLDDERQSAPVAILSHRWWNARFHASTTILGQTLYVKGLPFTVVGVAPPGFEGADPGQPSMDLWLPLQKNPALNPWGRAAGDNVHYQSPNWLCLLTIGRLRPGVSPQGGVAALTPDFRRTLAEASPVDPRDRAPELAFTDVRGVGTLRDDYRYPLRVLMTMVALVLLIASANVAMLLLLRNTARAREFALRRALGANARVLFTQLFSESVILVAAGCILAWGIAGVATEQLTLWSGLDVLIEPDRRVLLFTIAVSAVIALVFGLIPMRVTNRLPLAQTDRRRFSGRKAMVALQISMCAVLLFAGDLLYRTLRNLESRDLGMRTAGLLVFGVQPSANIQSDAEAIRLHLRLQEALRGVPGVDSVTLSTDRVGSGESSNDGALIDGRNPLPAKLFAPMRVNQVGSDFLRTLGIPIDLGRDFNDADIQGSARVAIVNQIFAGRYMPQTPPLGRQIAFDSHPKLSYTVVGVARNSKYTGVKEPDYPIVYFPFTKVRGVSGMEYELHTAGNPMSILGAATKVVHGIDPDLVLANPITQREQFDRTISQERLIARLAVVFGALAMALVLVGLYGSISYTVSQRTAEIGVRMALGARRGQVLAMVLRECAVLAIAGLAVGLPAAFALARALRSMLFGLSVVDPIALIVALTGIAIVCACATAIPARRAVSIDPIRALRMD